MSGDTASTAEVEQEGPSWDTTTDPNNPQPRFYPVCKTCSTAWAYRRFMSLSRGYVWAWSKECKHKGDPELKVVADRAADAALAGTEGSR